MKTLEEIIFRREVLDWRDKWIEWIPEKLESALPELLEALHERIDEMSIKETLTTQRYSAKHLQPIYEKWVADVSAEILGAAQEELGSINYKVLASLPELATDIAFDGARDNIVDGLVGTGAAGAAVLGIPLVAKASTVTAAYGLGLVGVTAISWPVALTGVTVLGGLAVFGGTRIAGYKSRAKQQFKDKTDSTIEKAVLPQPAGQPSVASELQLIIKDTATAYVKELRDVHSHSI